MSISISNIPNSAPPVLVVVMVPALIPRATTRTVRLLAMLVPTALRVRIANVFE